MLFLVRLPLASAYEELSIRWAEEMIDDIEFPQGHRWASSHMVCSLVLCRKSTGLGKLTSAFRYTGQPWLKCQVSMVKIYGYFPLGEPKHKVLVTYSWSMVYRNDGHGTNCAQILLVTSLDPKVFGLFKKTLGISNERSIME